MGLSWAENPCEPETDLYGRASIDRFADSWQDAHVLAPFILGTVLFGVLAVYSWRVRKDGFLHHDLFS
jgi:hypothetical protein